MFLVIICLVAAACVPITPTPVAPIDTQMPPTAVPPTPVPPTATAVPPTADPYGISAAITLDPAITEDADSLKICSLLYSGLVNLGVGGLEPALAESWVISDDQLDYIFKLRSDAVFSDGTLITSAEVVANFNRWLNPQDPLRGNGEYAAWERTFGGFLGEKDADGRAKSLVDGVQQVDTLTVLIHLTRPEPDLLTYLADPAFAILSPDALAASKYGGQGSMPVSSGPYTVHAWTQGTLQLWPNPTYWGTKPTESLTFNLY
ncbi:MAG: hypothetical protein JW987_10850 [Anaerolineaceae bacterium]|nr:hypothetical protein [Anaerolineaceae bacterium]